MLTFKEIRQRITTQPQAYAGQQEHVGPQLNAANGDGGRG